ncbi:MAG: carbohydrate kinase family protein [Anaerolineales bacterium]|nr:carbohydrate kinase family protein [Anaerolineales bacterium]MCB8953380.1 carbohydrate kinase family protein [Ardenticatenales bacterium]
MSRMAVCGLINVETTLRVEGFPLDYSPVRYPFFGIDSSVSGVGYNLALALTTLGDEVRLFSLIGADQAGFLVRRVLQQQEIADANVLDRDTPTAQSVVLYDANGRRMIFTDLKAMQEQVYPTAPFIASLPGCELAVLCNINFARPLLALARAAGVPVATDVHAIHDLEDDYNRDYMAAANILFMSHERLPCAPEAWARRVLARYGPDILVIGLGAAGALLAVAADNYVGRVPAVAVRPVVSTVGAGDALFASFCHFYGRDGDPYGALRRAVVFAGHKIGARGGAAGFLTEPALNLLFKQDGG